MSSDDTHRDSSTDDNQTGFADRTVEMSRERFECFECSFAAEDREEFDMDGLAMACPECQSLRVEHVFTSDDDDRDLVADGGLPTCKNCGETYLIEMIAGPGEAQRSCGCAFVPEFEVPDDTENAFANAAIRAMNATGDVETAALIHEDARGRLVADGGVPESFESLASTCENCGDDVDPERLIEGECPGCHYRQMGDGGTEYVDPLEAVDSKIEVEIECAVAIDAPRVCDGWCETIELDEPADYTGQIIELPGFDWECPECGNPHEFEIEGTRVSNLV